MTQDPHECTKLEEIVELKSEMDMVCKELTKQGSAIAWNERSIKNVEDDIKAIKGDTRWILRIILATILVALLKLLFDAGAEAAETEAVRWILYMR